ncbi:DUF1223 domain-containing protein [Pyxidicoccus parkwayensis]|uniref:DUF1223 domain-containing protein n=1 Tax=Pyxidicoccus parkwayensis TaxID=2813578 RepID=A0ABX7NW23_9BACT|nr:DUF1223 domain-containing protein [Pyxidicoccus parkwaysis]QSQ23141.1 DUF1223 domain-containing protein [Pyxidicoccus parkwaysis]
MFSALLALPLMLLTAAPVSRTPVVVELFTSEGCSSCPAADAALSRLARAQPLEGVELIPLGFHVDYWDDLGWKDAFASPAYSARQRRYALNGDENSVYTPQMVVDGERSFVGDEAKAREQAASAAKRAKVPVRVSARVDGDAAVLTVRLDAAPPPGTELWAALTEDGLSSRVTRGENAGHTLEHAAVVRAQVTLPAPKADPAGGFVTEARVPLAAGWKRPSLRAVAVLQESRGPVRGAATAALAPKS